MLEGMALPKLSGGLLDRVGLSASSELLVSIASVPSFSVPVVSTVVVVWFGAPSASLFNLLSFLLCRLSKNYSGLLKSLISCDSSASVVSSSLDPVVSSSSVVVH